MKKKGIKNHIFMDYVRYFELLLLIKNLYEVNSIKSKEIVVFR